MQQITRIDGTLLRDMLTGGLRSVKDNTRRLNGLNVFPVPDGDTGTNMKMTLEGGIRAVSGDNTGDVAELMRVFSRGALLGARGNSGIILSQYIKGISLALDEFGEPSVTAEQFASALGSGVKKAYDAVISPVEGTILTVMRESADCVSGSDGDTPLDEFFTRLTDSMRKSLMNTPNLLPVLREAGVIDSGGAGLLCMFEGMEKTLYGGADADGSPESTDDGNESPSSPTGRFDADSLLEYGYCTEFILQLQHKKVDIESFDVGEIVAFLETVGSSIVALKEDDLVKVHVHTFTPGRVIDFCQRFGEYYSFKMENMSVQHSESIAAAPKPEHKKYAVVAVCTGSGIISYFGNIGADKVIDGGETANPSVADFTNAYDSLSADFIIVLPDNPNALLAAEQSAKLYKKADVRIVPTRSVAEGYSALSMMDLSQDTVEQVMRGMSDAAAGVTTGLVTYAIRDVTSGAVRAEKGDFIGLSGGRLLSSAKNKVSAAFSLIKSVDGIEDKQVITAFYGSGVTEAERSSLASELKKEFPLTECGFVSGGQDIYSFIFAIE